MKILLIEDHAELAMQLGDFLGSLGWNIDFSSTGEQGITLALANEYDLIILDLNLPDIDGTHVCKEIKSENKFNVPVLMLTARDSFADKVKGFDLGADEYLTKPFDTEELKTRVKNLLDIRDILKKRYGSTVFDIQPETKNQTDTDLCVEFAVKKGATTVTMIGVTGHRLDHTLANIFLLRRLCTLGVESRIIDANNEIYLVTDHLKLKGRKGDLLSVLPVSDKVTGLTLTGLEYPLKDAAISMGSSLGISNYFKKSWVTISVLTGVLLVTKSKD